jgi:hypothetical protein
MDVSTTIQGHFWLVEGVKRNKNFNEANEKEVMRRLLKNKELEIKLLYHLVCTRAVYDIVDEET